MEEFGRPVHPVPQSVWLLITLIISTIGYSTVPEGRDKP
jgi:hypothetical protein